MGWDNNRIVISRKVNVEGMMISYIVSFNPEILEWDQLVAELQNVYLKERSGSPLKMGQTLQLLEQLTIANSIGKELLKKSLTWDAIGMLDFFVLLSDHEVTEIFSNQIGNKMVISHREYGRCITNIIFTRELWDALKLRAEYDTGQSLNPVTPALKVSFQTELGNLRISLQSEPLSSSGPTFILRRLPRNPITLEILLNQDFISQKQILQITGAVSKRMNIIIAGEPGSGKTTLANALLLTINPNWRLIVMEDAQEIQLSNETFPMMTHYQLPVVGTDNRYIKRVDEISRLLHRSPDYVFLGELQNQDDTRVAFEGFAAGIRGMATTHANNINGLLTRWESSHNMSLDLLNSIDIVILMKREYNISKFEINVSKVYLRKNEGFEEWI